MALESQRQQMKSPNTEFDLISPGRPVRPVGYDLEMAHEAEVIPDDDATNELREFIADINGDGSVEFFRGANVAQSTGNSENYRLD